jgi:serine/threonine-protein kinase
VASRIVDLVPGVVVRDKYEIVEKVGAGGMSSVYKARHLAFDELRALKVIAYHLLDDDSFLERFRDEAILSHRLTHPNIVRVDDLDSLEDGRPFIVMEYVDGPPLSRVLKEEGPLDLRRAVSIAGQTCRALEAAHAQGVMHRDVKSDNLLLATAESGRPQVKVLDFGLASSLDGTGPGAAGLHGRPMGTPRYLAPEVAAQRTDVDERADLYSLGIVLYEMVTGRVPFDAPSPVETLRLHIDAAPLPPELQAPGRDIPPELSALILKALEKDPTKRFSSATAMLAAFTALADVLS